MILRILAHEQVETKAVPFRLENLNLINEHAIEPLFQQPLLKRRICPLEKLVEIIRPAFFRVKANPVAAQQFHAEREERGTSHIPIRKSCLCHSPAVIIRKVFIVAGKEKPCARIQARQLKAAGDQQHTLPAACTGKNQLISLRNAVDCIDLPIVQPIGLYRPVVSPNASVLDMYAFVFVQYILLRNRKFGAEPLKHMVDILFPQPLPLHKIRMQYGTALLADSFDRVPEQDILPAKILGPCMEFPQHLCTVNLGKNKTKVKGNA